MNNVARKLGYVYPKEYSEDSVNHSEFAFTPNKKDWSFGLWNSSPSNLLHKYVRLEVIIMIFHISQRSHFLSPQLYLLSLLIG